MKAEKYTREADLCADFISEVEKRGDWQAYPETQGFDILLAHKEKGIQIGVEAKLRPNLKVITQALPHWLDQGDTGPDFRAVLVPISDSDFARICGALGIVVLEFRRARIGTYNSPIRDLPRLDGPYSDLQIRHWHDWCPSKRLKLPDYVPDVQAGSSAPVQLSEWKVKAIKLQIILQERPVTRADFKALRLSPTRWLDPCTGWLVKGGGGFVPGPGMPDLRAQHPKNFAEIEADKAKWMADLPAFQQVGVEHDLFGEQA